MIRGFAKKNKSEITREMGGWVQVSLRILFVKSSKNSPKPVIIFLSNIPHVYSVCRRIHC